MSTTKTLSKTKKGPAEVEILSCFSRPKATHNVQGTYPAESFMMSALPRKKYGYNDFGESPNWNYKNPFKQWLICPIWIVNGNIMETPSECLKHLQAFTEMSCLFIWLFLHCFFVSGIQGKLETQKNPHKNHRPFVQVILLPIAAREPASCTWCLFGDLDPQIIQTLWANP